jgi:hypothetical protein
VPLLVVISLLCKATCSAFLEEGEDLPDGDCVGGEFVQAKVHVLANGAQPFLPFCAIPVVIIGLRGFGSFGAVGWSLGPLLESFLEATKLKP